MKKILILFAHPALSRSTTNRALRQAVEGLDGITVHDLYHHYPEFFIDVAREQELCQEHQVLVFQHPLYWYSTPALVKEWFDLVLEHGWAYGSTGTALVGKICFQAVTAGGDERSYSQQGLNMFALGELLTPFRATANLCGMHWLPPFTVLGVHRGLPAGAVAAHASRYRELLIALRDETVDLAQLAALPSLNSHSQALPATGI